MPMHVGADPVQEALKVAQQLRQDAVQALIIDTAPGDRQQTCMPQIAKVLDTTCQHIYHLQASQILQLIEKVRPVSK